MLPNTFYIQSRYKIHQKSYEKVSSKKDNFNVFLKCYKSGPAGCVTRNKKVLRYHASN